MLESGIYSKGSLNILLIFKEISSTLPEDVGAVATFLGVTKGVGVGDRRVNRLEMESYEEHANEIIRRICEEVRVKYKLSFVKIYHLVGEFKVGEPIVFVVVAGRSRDGVFSALREAVERYKTEPALFKKEVYIDGTHAWISHG